MRFSDLVGSKVSCNGGCEVAVLNKVVSLTKEGTAYGSVWLGALMRHWISKLIELSFGSAQGADVRKRRATSILQGLLTGLANRAVGVAVSFLSVPLTIGYLGPEQYGVWTLIGSLLAWMALADFGIGNGLTNAVAGALGSDRPELVRTHVSTAIAVLTTTSLVLAVGIVLVWPMISWVQIFNVTSESAKREVGPAMATAIAVFLVGFPLSVIGRTYNASQNGKIANYWGAAGNVLSLVSLILVTKTQGGLVLLVLAVSGTNLLVQLISGIWLFAKFRPEFAPRMRHVNRASAKLVTSVGAQFFFIQIIALSIFQTDALLIAHYLGAKQTPAYSLTYRLFELPSLIQTIMFSYLWVAYAEAIARGDIAWVKKAFKLTLSFSLASTLVVIVPMALLAKPFIQFWTKGAVVPPNDLVVWMAGWSLINALCSPIACLLAAASQMKAQLIYGTALAIGNLLISVVLIQSWGISGAIAGTVLSYIVFNCGPTILDVSFLIRRLARNQGQGVKFEPHVAVSNVG